ncbi:hypothetical protein [Coxiella-like endosymbiont]|uniref:hypothetical protein n=1 Tax=Coxiella-like endosymbiont TaxID=1592897 RepID=UPI00272DBDAE|nr:hypothetical protein [Coxiella-like endosymbiont]
MRAPLVDLDFLEMAQSFKVSQHVITNFEMETATTYELSNLLNHECCSIGLRMK